MLCSPMKKQQHMHAAHLTKRGFSRTTLWSLLFCIAIVIAVSGVGRAARNFRAALTDKPDIALYLLLEQEKISNSTLLRESDTERDYLAETKNGPKLVKLKKGDIEWYVALVEELHQ
jgi:hypothetical protein